MKNQSGLKGVWFVFAICAVVVIPASAQTLTVLHSFTGTDGRNPYAALVQATNGMLYGTAQQGGANSSGTVFKITTGGALTTLYNFCPVAGCADGSFPKAGLVQAQNGTFYGTTSGGFGTIFKMTAGGTLSTLYTVCSLSSCTDGETPTAGLIQGSNGALYGTTFAGVAHNNGTAFDISTSGVLTTVYNFCSQSSCKDGASPEAGLIQGTDNNFYGTTYYGGTFTYYGTLFKISPTETFTSLHSFDGTDGDEPIGGLLQATDGNFYGTTQTDGANGYGTVFRITSTGTLTTLYNFCAVASCADGEFPQDSLIQGTDGKLYGTTFEGGAHGDGTIFSITTSGTLTTLHSFDGTDGNQPLASLAQDTNGTFYGTTYSGGTSNYGTVFSLSVGLGPFVKTQPASGKGGASINILESQLTGATSVTFNGISAVFKLVSGS